jgi:hypothetical protein
MSAQHGPAPWIAEEFLDEIDERHVDVEIRDCEDQVVCVASPFGGEHFDQWDERGKANVYLVCAAPELFESVKDSLRFMRELRESGAVKGDYSVIDRLEALIAKAEGRQ